MGLEEAMIVKTTLPLPDWQGALYKQKPKPLPAGHASFRNEKRGIFGV